ncbi:aldo/keto reductase [Pseudolysinimonas sp.]|uniref:aldo/keto reductase n=1 Tax=Pseudolysinimonas sp. TaxID=2680009 RepID=UPI003F811DA8
MTVPSLQFNDGHAIPQLGFGVYRVDPAETERIVTDALEVGYRHIDTAALYGNEEGVGRAIANSGIPRDELFITTKLWNTDQGADATRAAFASSLEKLGLDRVDLYLIHWPAPARDLFVETWRTFEEFRDAGTATSIGVSNFRPQDLDRLAAETDTVPAINQIELHPFFIQQGLRDYDAAHGILTESWGPLGHAVADVLGSGPLAEIAEAHGVGPAQVVIRWHLQHGLVVIPKSNNRDRMAQNFDVFGFELTDDEMARIDGLDTGTRSGADPDTLN